MITLLIFVIYFLGVILSGLLLTLMLKYSEDIKTRRDIRNFHPTFVLCMFSWLTVAAIILYCVLVIIVILIANLLQPFYNKVIDWILKDKG